LRLKLEDSETDEPAGLIQDDLLLVARLLCTAVSSDIDVAALNAPYGEQRAVNIAQSRLVHVAATTLTTAAPSSVRAHCCAVLCCAVLCCAVLCCAVLCCAVSCRAVP
jgi:hypothetical protein